MSMPRTDAMGGAMNQKTATKMPMMVFEVHQGFVAVTGGAGVSGLRAPGWGRAE
jgi:hypothetical protein